MTMETTETRASRPKGPLPTMIAQVAKRDLARLAAQMAGIAESKSTMPMLRCVLLRATDKKLTMAATDLYLSLFGGIPADVEEPGSIAIAAKDLVDRVKLMPDGPVTLEVKDNALTIKAKGAARRFTLRGMPGDDFPPLPTPNEAAPKLALPAGVLRKLIARTVYAVSTDETRAHLNSALLEWEGETVRMVATDGHRLAKAEATVAGRSAASTMLIPLKAVHEIGRLCDEVGPSTEEEPGELEIVPSGAVVFFRTGGQLFGVKTVDAQFPPYAQVIPKDSAKSAKAPRAALADAFRAVAVAASSTTGGVKLVLSKKKMKLTSESPDSGDGADEVDVEYDGPAFTIGLNARYAIDALSALADEDVALGFSGELDPMVVTSEGFTGVIMPMRI